MGEIRDILNSAIEKLNYSTPLFDREELKLFVGQFLERRDRFLDLYQREKSPLYIIDRPALLDRASRFTAAFRENLPSAKFFYAIKSNNHPAIAEILAENGFGLDVSSGEELKQVLHTQAAEIVFSGPGKTDNELKLAVANSPRVTVLMDSFGELDRLETAARQAGTRVRAGIRLTTDETGLWRKFGIPLAELPRLWAEAKKKSLVDLCGLQFHTSWNMNPDNQIAFIARLGKTLAGLDKAFLAAIEFIDIGGGYWPVQGEWLIAAGTPEGRFLQTAGAEPGKAFDHYRIPSTPIESFARSIGEAVQKHLFPHVKVAICAEPGRWICHDSMHIMLQVIDKKADDLVITDGGTNAVGWERYETDYFPVINLSQPDLVEHECHILGSLCTPHDVWGFTYFGKGIEPGDILLIPTQGAYTYSLRQNFIKPLPRTVFLDGGDLG